MFHTRQEEIPNCRKENFSKFAEMMYCHNIYKYINAKLYKNNKHSLDMLVFQYKQMLM